MIPEYMSALANHLWQSTVFVLIAGLLAVAMRKNSASVRYGLWLAASMKFLVPFSLLVTFGGQFEWWPTSEVAQPQWLSMVDEISQPFAVTGSAPQIIASSQSMNGILAVGLLLWLCGFGTIVFRWVREWQRLRAAVRVAAPVDLKCPLETLSTPAPVGPGVVGIFRPVLLLPEGITDRLTPPQLKAILLHELCHVRRHDNLAAAAHMIVEAIFWFYPLVWWIRRPLIEERERACDEEVLRVLGEPQTYAEGILNVCRFHKESSLACVSGVTSSNLKKRMEDIMVNRQTVKLNFAKKALLAVAGITAIALPIAYGSIQPATQTAQVAPEARLDFEIAAIKSKGDLDPKVTGLIRQAPNGRLTAQDARLSFLLQTAYGLRRYQVSGGPEWINSASYDIEATAAGSATPQEKLVMLQSLLENKFKLKVHRETRFLPVFVLTAASGGLKLQQPIEGSCFTPGPNARPLPPVPGQPQITPCGRANVMITTAGSRLDGGKVSMAELSRVLSAMLGRTVIDKTGFTDTFDAHLTFAANAALAGLPGGPPSPPIADYAGAPIFTTLEEQLGLKLESGTGPVEVLVIDSVERPAEN